MAKNLLPIDSLIAEYLREGISDAHITYRQIAAATGMSINRIGIILRQEPPPATIGEMGQIARVLGLTASALLARAELELAEQATSGGALNDDDALNDTSGERANPTSYRKSDYGTVSHPYTDETGELMDE